MTKEEAYNKATLQNLGTPDGTRMDIIYAAMEIHSRQMAIAFSDWVQENEYFIPEGYTGYVKRTGQETAFRANQFIKPDDLYNLFLEQNK